MLIQRVLQNQKSEAVAVLIKHTFLQQGRGYDSMHDINRSMIMISYSKSLSMLRGFNVLVHK
jgi:hypothetical protein